MNTDFVFFTCNDFTKTDGGTIRMLGIIEALVSQGHAVTLLSNIKNKGLIPAQVSHFPIGHVIPKRSRQFLLLIMAVFPKWLAIPIISLWCEKCFSVLNECAGSEKKVIFCEYFDLALGFIWSCKTKNFSHIYDVHGIAKLEFFGKEGVGLVEFLISRLKGFVASSLDKKIYSSCGQAIVLNETMGDYFIKNFKSISSANLIFVDDGITPSFNNFSVNSDLRDSIVAANNLSPPSKKLFFAGTFKNMGGVSHLLEAVVRILDGGEHDIELLLVGAGEEEEVLRKRAKASGYEKKIHFLGRCDYSDLRTYQSLADIIICPDRRHPYSDMIVHTKYYEALMSEKIVINSGSAEVLRINEEHNLSLTFEPSNIDDLEIQINNALRKFSTEIEKCSSVKEKVLNNFTYQNTVSGLIDSFQE